VAAAGVAADGLAEGWFGVQGGDGEQLVAWFERVAAAAGQHALAADHGDDQRALGQLELVGAAADRRGVVAVLGAQQGDHVVDADGGVEQPGEDRGRGDGGVDPQSSVNSQVLLGLSTRATTRGTP
jgi:hypothetical protein